MKWNKAKALLQRLTGDCKRGKHNGVSGKFLFPKLNPLTTMPITYYLQPNPVTPDPNDQSARVIANTSLSLDDIISKMTKRGTLVTETDAKAVLNLFFEIEVGR
ncbi:MAG: DNA-binding domain-containing protein [Chloroherpetonaceae bacterium]